MTRQCWLVRLATSLLLCACVLVTNGPVAAQGTGSPATSSTAAVDTSDRFFGAVQSIVTSSGTNDPGLFEANLREERFLPFEGAGAESTWQLELPEGSAIKVAALLIESGRMRARKG